TKLRSMKGKTFTVLGTDTSGSFLYADYNGTRGFVRAQDFTFTSGTVVEQKPNNNNNTTGATGGNVTSNNTGMAASGATPGVGSKSQSDVWGSITVPGTGKNYPIYGNYTNKKGNLYYYDYSNIKSYNYIHTTTAKGSQVAVVMGHNMRKSKTYFHNLHHIQNAILGKSTCDYCKASCSGYGKSISASWEGSRSWEVVAFFEVPKNKAYKNILPIMAQPWNYTTSQYLSSVASYVNTFSGKSWANTSALTDNGKYMMLITCGDKTDSSNIAKLYMLLKAVG
ncbi:MAG: sortase, partial [Eubacteriales bacterium]|nr:sortase [Eubacteriales bacterium]